MVALGYALFILMCLTAFFAWRIRRDGQKARLFLADLLSAHDEMYETMALGLYHRFKQDTDQDINADSFPMFVKSIIDDYYGGSSEVNLESENLGVNVLQKRETGVYLGVAKCQQDSVGIEAVALLHSRILKDQAQGGFLVTTGFITPGAVEYAKELGLDLELIDGPKLVKYWIRSAESKKEQYPLLQPEVSIY